MDAQDSQQPADLKLSLIHLSEQTLPETYTPGVPRTIDTRPAAAPLASGGAAVCADESPDLTVTYELAAGLALEPQGQTDEDDSFIDHSLIAANDAMFGGLADQDYLETIAGMEAAQAAGVYEVAGAETIADPFAAITDADRDRIVLPLRGKGEKTTGLADLLEPSSTHEANPPSRRFKHWDHGEPSTSWLYRDAAGAVIGATARYDVVQADGLLGKIILPWTHGRRAWTDRNGKPCDITGWHCKAPPPLRSIYGLDRLAARLEAPVMITEGEKAADAASVIFPDMACLTSSGGSKAPGRSDWSPLKGRRVVIWPDQDPAGRDYAASVAKLLSAVGALSVLIVGVPTDWPRGWDLADELPDGVDAAWLRRMVLDARNPFDVPNEAGGRATTTIDGVRMPSGFRMTQKGLLFCPQGSDKNPEPAPIFIAAPFEVVGRTRCDAGESWGVLFKWRDREGTHHQWAIPLSQIHCQGNEIAQRLEHAGLSCGSDAAAHGLLKRFVGEVDTMRLLRCVSRTGWHEGDGGPVFVLPGGEAFGPAAASMVLQTDHAQAAPAYRAAGALKLWQTDVAALAVGNDRLALFLSAAFAGALLDVMGEPSGGVHLVGGSRSGKSTAAAIAGSVWGKPTADAQLRPWRGTANGLEGVAADTADTLLILDEMGQADAREVGDAIYMLANEAGKQRATRTGAARPRAAWRSLFLSTGEITLSQKLGEAGKKSMAGLEVRLVNLPADAGVGMGVFQNLHGRPDPATFAEEIRDAARSNYGVAARAFLKRLADDRAAKQAELRETLSAMRTAFITRNVPVDAAGQVRSVAGRFALIGAAGELARDYGVLTWPRGEAMRAAAACFDAWLRERGGAGSGEDVAAMAQVRAFLEAHGESRFTLLSPRSQGENPAPPENARTINRAGFRQRLVGGAAERWEYLILPETWKGEVCKGIDPKRTADLLIGRELMKGTTRHRSVVMTIPGEGKRRVYSVSGAILGHGEADGVYDAAG